MQRQRLVTNTKVVVLTPKCVSPAFLVDVVWKVSILCFVIAACPASVVVVLVAKTPCPLLHHPICLSIGLHPLGG